MHAQPCPAWLGRIITDEVLGNQLNAFWRHEDHHLGLDGICDTLRIFRGEILLLDRLQQFLVEPRHIQPELVDLRMIKERHGRMIFNSPLEIINGNIRAKLTLRQFTALERRAGKSYPRGIRKEPQHIVGENAVVRPVRLIRENDDFMAGMDWRPGRRIELLDQREEESVIALKSRLQLFTAPRHARLRLCRSQTATGGKGSCDLII